MCQSVSIILGSEKFYAWTTETQMTPPCHLGESLSSPSENKGPVGKSSWEHHQNTFDRCACVFLLPNSTHILAYKYAYTQIKTHTQATNTLITSPFTKMFFCFLCLKFSLERYMSLVLGVRRPRQEGWIKPRSSGLSWITQKSGF